MPQGTRAPVTERPVWRYQAGGFREIPDRLAVEAPLRLQVNGEPYQMWLYLPGLEEELVLGFLLSEGLIRNRNEVEHLQFHPGDEPRNPVLVAEVRLRAQAPFPGPTRTGKIAWSAGGVGMQGRLEEVCREIPPVGSTLRVSPEVLLQLMSRLPGCQPVFQATGGTHAVALASPDGATFLCAEDVGRHNAMDKVIGRALLENRDLGGLIALLSGRISFEMALKAVRAGLPILAGVSAPTSLAVELAERLNLTLVGFVRGENFNVYAHPQRLQSNP